MPALSRKGQSRQAQLVRRYVASLPEKSTRIAGLWQQLESGDWNPDALARLQAEIHRLVGSAGVYGLDDLAQLAQALEASLKSGLDSAGSRSRAGRQVAELLGGLESGR